MEEREFNKRIAYANIMLKEYESLRSEIIHKQSLFNNIVNFSFAIIGAILASIAAALRLDVNQGATYVLIVTAIVIPLVCWFAIIQFYLEFVYTARLARYIVSIEYKINNLFNEQLLFWESGIRRWNEDNSNPTERFFSFMVIRDRLIEELLVLPSFFSILAICSALFSLVFGMVFYPSLQASVRNIVLWLMIIPLAIGVPIRH